MKMKRDKELKHLTNEQMMKDNTENGKRRSGLYREKNVRLLQRIYKENKEK